MSIPKICTEKKEKTINNCIKKTYKYGKTTLIITFYPNGMRIMDIFYENGEFNQYFCQKDSNIFKKWHKKAYNKSLL